jgi:hypothetical protein
MPPERFGLAKIDPMRTRLVAPLILMALTALAGGCARVPPPFTDAEGVLLIDGKPLPNAEVEFYPEVDGFGGDLNSTATTDDDGRFKLTGVKGQSGAVVAKHRVVVRDPPMPAELRGQNLEGQFTARLKNRPIPEKYRSAASTPARVEVKAGQTDYKVELTRP